jgi:beta-galactosidase
MNYSAAAQSVTLTTTVVDSAGATVTTMGATQSIAAGQLYTFDQTSTSIATPRLWSPDNPYLYKVNSTLTVGGEIIDQYQSPLGFRWFSSPVANTPFKFNGQNLFIRGINRHQDRAGCGFAMSNEQHRADMVLIKNAGFNYLRHAHYAADPAVMQACNELGILVWLENPVTCCISTDPGFLTNAKSQLTEMIRQNYNNPCVVLWGMGNESDQGGGTGGANPNLTEAFTNTVHSALNTLAHQLDATRPTTGCNWKLASNQAIVDAYAPQIWSGWYGGTYTGYNPTQLIGEYGADAALDHHKEPGTQVQGDWSQEYQCLLHEAYVAQGEARKTQFPGHCAWILADFASPRSDRTKAAGNTIDYMNQKGLMLYDHVTPKDVYYFYQSFYTIGAKKPMVYIVSHTWLNRWTAAAAKNVWVYSNCEQVELFNAIGSQSYGKHTRDAGENAVKTRFQWNGANVRYNVLYAEGLVGGKVVARDTIILQNLPKAPVTAAHAPEAEVNRDVPCAALFSTPAGAWIRVLLKKEMKVGVALYGPSGVLLARIEPAALCAGVHRIELGSRHLPRGVYCADISMGGDHRSQVLVMQ